MGNNYALMDYAESIGKNTSNLTFWDMMQYIKWLEDTKRKTGGNKKMSKLDNVAKVGRSHRALDTTDDLVKRLGYSDAKFKPATAVKPHYTFRDLSSKIKMANAMMSKSNSASEKAVLDTKVTFDTILRHSANYSDSDPSINALEIMINKKAVDSTAKQYWEKYFGSFGKLMTREYKDLAKYRSASVKELMDMRTWFRRTWGSKCAAGVVLENTMIESVQG